jgi:TatD DNase family protein
MSYADCHAHLDYPDFKDDIPAVVDNCISRNISLIITTATDIDSCKKNIALAEKYSSILYAAAGIHPHEVDKFSLSDMAIISEFSKYDTVVAIGETGLDWHYNNSSRENQELFFRRHIEIALETRKPLVVHSRGAERKAFQMLQEHKVPRAYFHCYTGDAKLGLEIAQAGYMIGVTGIVTFNNGTNAELIKKFPLQSLLTETDSPFLTPKPYRGKRNDPSLIPMIVDKIKTLFPETSGAEIESILFNNARLFFNNSR